MEFSIETLGKIREFPLNNTNLKLLNSCDVYVLAHRTLRLVTQMFERCECRRFLYIKDNSVYFIAGNKLCILHIANFDDFFDVLLERGEISDTPLDKKTAHFYTVLYAWSLGTAILESSLLKLAVPKQFKAVSSQYLYRGIRLRPSSVKALLAGKSVELKPRKCTSWTTLPSIAKHFRNTEVNGAASDGCVIRIPTKQLPVFVNLKKALGNFQVFEEREVIVLGNGVDSVNSDNIYWRSWKTDEETRQEDARSYYVTSNRVVILESVYVKHEMLRINSLAAFKKYAGCPAYYATHDRQFLLKTGGKVRDISFRGFVVVGNSTLLDLDHDNLITVRNLDSLLKEMLRLDVILQYSSAEATAILLSANWRIALDGSPAVASYLKSLAIPSDYRTVSFNPVYIKLVGLSDAAKTGLENRKPFQLNRVTFGYRKKQEAIFEMKYSGEKYADNSAVISCTVTPEQIFLNPAVAFPKNEYCKNSVFIAPHKIENYKLVAKSY